MYQETPGATKPPRGTRRHPRSPPTLEPPSPQEAPEALSCNTGYNWGVDPSETLELGRRVRVVSCPQDAASKEKVSKKAASKEKVSKETDSKEKASKEAVSNQAASKEAASKEAASRDATSKEASGDWSWSPTIVSRLVSCRIVSCRVF